MRTRVHEQTPAAAALLTALRGSLPPGVALATQPIGAQLPLLGTEDEAALPMRPARRAEFSAGRAAARTAMQELGLGPAPIPMGPDRAPQWPAGLVGSITHGAGLAVAALAPARKLGALGIDLEPDEPLERDLWPSLFGGAEERRLEQEPAPAHAARALFVIKEAAFKAQYALTRAMLDFHEVEVLGIDPQGRTELAFAVGTAPARGGLTLSGRLCRAQGLLAAAFWSPPTDSWK